MARLFGISNAIAIDMCNAIVDAIDVGGGTPYLKIYDGTRPASVDDPVTTQNILSEHVLSTPAAFGAAADIAPGAMAPANSIADDTSANNSGTATWARIFGRDGTAHVDLNVGTLNADVILDNVVITAAQLVKISSATVTVQETSP